MLHRSPGTTGKLQTTGEAKGHGHACMHAGAASLPPCTASCPRHARRPRWPVLPSAGLLRGLCAGRARVGLPEAAAHAGGHRLARHAARGALSVSSWHITCGHLYGMPHNCQLLSVRSHAVPIAGWRRPTTLVCGCARNCRRASTVLTPADLRRRAGHPGVRGRPQRQACVRRRVAVRRPGHRLPAAVRAGDPAPAEHAGHPAPMCAPPLWVWSMVG